MTMIGVAVGLGNIWRFPYMVGQFGGAPFVLVYLAAMAAIGAPALMAEWTLGRHTRLGTVGAFQKAGLRFGKQIGWLLFIVILAAAGYYTNAIGWVLLHALGSLGMPIDAGLILPPDSGFNLISFSLQIICTGTVILACAFVLTRGLRSGIEVASKVIMPFLLISLVILIVRSVTLEGAMAGIHWYILKFDWGSLSGSVILAALGQAVFSLSLGGTFMVVYGSYLNQEDDLRTNAILTAAGDTIAGLLAGLAIFPAVFALGMPPDGGPALLFSTLPGVFEQIPLGGLFGLLFFMGLFGAAFLSNLAAFEVLIAGLTDNTSFKRKHAVRLVSGMVFLIAIPPMINLKIFVPWDLTFGSGMQTLGSLLAVVTVGWCLSRSEVLREIGEKGGQKTVMVLYYWLKFVIPIGILLVGMWWVWAEFIS